MEIQLPKESKKLCSYGMTQCPKKATWKRKNRFVSGLVETVYRCDEHREKETRYGSI